jgi:hypothetical protein
MVMAVANSLRAGGGAFLPAAAAAAACIWAFEGSGGGRLRSSFLVGEGTLRTAVSLLTHT